MVAMAPLALALATALAAGTPSNPLALASFAPTNATITGLERGFLGHAQPEFRWALRCEGCAAVRQTAYRLTLHEHPHGAAHADELAEPLFDSGRVEKAALRHATASVLPGRDSSLPLRSDRRYRWELTVWAVANGAAVSGRTAATFQTALLHDSDWAGAEWIGGGTALRTDTPPLPSGAIAAATAYVSGVGCFELSVNGEKVAPGVFLEPSWANVPMVRCNPPPLSPFRPARALPPHPIPPAVQDP